MAKLTAAQRRRLPSKMFALPETRQYPIHDRAHAADALARVDANGSPEQQAKVRAAVGARYPEMPKHHEAAKAKRKGGSNPMVGFPAPGMLGGPNPQDPSQTPPPTP